ncbi:MAG: ABC transporter ATP-binding protein/permease [Acidobacteria bacterium]|nr:ABC transporter ATP-binding protein/permease [Acidobacteriota bacterium]
MRKLVRHLRPYRRPVGFGVAFIFASVCLGVVGPFVLGRVIDELQVDAAPHRLTRYALFLLGLAAASAGLQFAERRLLSDLWCGVEYKLRQDLCAHLMRQPASFFQAHRTGDLMTRATGDVTAVSVLTGPLLTEGLQTALVILLVVPIMLWINVRLTLLLLAALPFVALTGKYIAGRTRARLGEIQELSSRIAARAQENLTNVRAVRAYVREEAEMAAFGGLNDRSVTLNLNFLRVSAALSPLIHFLLAVGFVLIIWYGGGLAVRGEITVGEFTMFTIYMTQLSWPLYTVGNFAGLLQRGLASFRRLDELFSVEPEVKDAPGVREQPPVRGRVEFRGLTYHAGGHSEPLLYGLDLTVEAGQTVAFVGRTGSGKSTLLSLVARAVEAPPGTVFVDGVSVRDYPLSQLRGSIGYVPQETFLFSGTLAENIAFGADRPNLADVEWAALMAGLEDDLRGFPEGLNTTVGERGVRLSGGQKQRTAIARALQRRPRILILDDALSAVDTHTEAEVLANLRGFMRERTTLIVSHRVSTVRGADLICVIDGGRIAGRGTHEELLASGGVYAELYRLQHPEGELELD